MSEYIVPLFLNFYSILINKKNCISAEKYVFKLLKKKLFNFPKLIVAKQFIIHLL